MKLLPQILEVKSYSKMFIGTTIFLIVYSRKLKNSWHSVIRHSLAATESRYERVRRSDGVEFKEAGRLGEDGKGEGEARLQAMPG